MILLELLLLVYFTYVVGYTLIFSIAGHNYRVPKTPIYPSNRRFCVLIPAYREDNVILETVQRAVDQLYPREYFEVVVIADGLQPTTLRALAAHPVTVIEVKFEQSTKVKALNRAMEVLQNRFDYAVILDADNTMDPDFLRKVNKLIYAKRYLAIQCQRLPKNEDCNLSFLDGLSESINNHIYRQGTTALNLSASINGSGFVIDYGILKKHMRAMTSVGGFDRELEVLLVKDGIKVYYYKSARVMDEKVTDMAVFQNQRKRWIASQYFYLRKYFVEGTKALFRGNISFFNSAVLRNIQLPRLINAFVLLLIAVVAPFVGVHLHFDYRIWPVLGALNFLAIFMAIPRDRFSWPLLKSLTRLPLVFFRMTSLLFKLKGANGKFIHTPHAVSTVRSAEKMQGQLTNKTT